MFGSNTHRAERYDIQNNQVGAVVRIMPTSFKVGEELEQVVALGIFLIKISRRLGCMMGPDAWSGSLAEYKSALI